MNEQSRLFDFLYHQQAHYPREVLLASKTNGRWQTYSTDVVVDTVNRLSAGLLDLELSGGDMTVENQDKVAVISRNCPEWVMLDLACQQIGVLLVPVYPTTGLKEMEFIFNDASVKYVFVNGTELAEKVNSIRNLVPSLQHVFSFDGCAGTSHWNNIMATVSQVSLQQVEQAKNKVRASHCATIIYTSGTTGTPKGVMLSHRNIVMNVLNAVRTFPFPVVKEGKALSFLPLNHIFERLATYIYFYTGVSIYYAESMETIGENLKEVKPMLFTTVPRLLEKVYDRIMAKGAELTGIRRRLFYWAVGLAEKFDAIDSNSLWYRLQLWLANRIIFSKWRQALGNSVKFIITGGAACQVKLLRIFTAAGVPVYEGYGPTENSPVISVNCRKKGGTCFGTVGLVIEGQEVKIESDGEICVKGPSVMMGYYKRPDLTSEVIRNGWLHTGDIGEFAAGKYLKITDRKKELFKTSGGKYVAPQPLENKLKESPYIEQAMIVGADKKFVAALIVPSFSSLEGWMKTNGLAYTNKEEALNNENVRIFFNQLIASCNESFNHVEQVKQYRLLPDEWTVDSGEMTPKLSIRRKVILEKYDHIIQDIYA